MTEACIVCETELGCTDPTGWLYDPERSEAICPWCIKDLHKIRELVRTHNGSDSHARTLFDEIQLLMEKAR